MSDNVVDIKDAPLTGPLAIILRRRAEIKAQREYLQAQMEAATTERNALWTEDRELEQAEATVRKLLERRA